MDLDRTSTYSFVSISRINCVRQFEHKVLLVHIESGSTK